MCSPLESKEKAHADNCGFIACSRTCGHFPTLLLFPDNGKPGGHINSPAGLVPRNALVLIESDADLPDGLATRPYWRFNAQLSEESHRFFAEHLLNNRPQMRAPSATRKVATLTKQMKIGLCEQVRVNWKTALSTLEETSPLRCYFIVGFKYFGLIPAPNLSARLPICFNVASRVRNSFGLASAKTFLISAACLRKIGAISSLPFAVSDTTRTRRSSGLSTRLTMPLSTRRSTAVLIEPGVRWTFGPIVFTGKGPLFRSTSSIRKSVSSIPVSSSPA